MLNEFFIYGKNEMINCVYAIFNKVLDLGIFPDSWSEGFIVPLHKKGSTNVLITLTIIEASLY